MRTTPAYDVEQCLGLWSGHGRVNIEMGVSQNYGYLIGGPHNKDCSILGSILGVPLFWETTKSSHSLSKALDLGVPSRCPLPIPDRSLDSCAEAHGQA